MSEDIVINETVIIPSSEIQFRFSRSSGPGGQNVNKLSTKAELIFDLANSSAFDESTKERLRHTLGRNIDTTGKITLTSQESRSQFQNKQIAIEKFILMIRKALVIPKIRKETKTSHSSILKRLERKNKRGAIKKSRTKKIDLE
jgi:ribosome-associated protein